MASLAVLIAHPHFTKCAANYIKLETSTVHIMYTYVCNFNDDINLYIEGKQNPHVGKYIIPHLCSKYGLSTYSSTVTLIISMMDDLMYQV